MGQSQQQKQPLYELLHHPDIWRACDNNDKTAIIPTGHDGLDKLLPGGGWPASALNELLLERRGQGELRLLLPALVKLNQNDDDRCLIWVAPPWVPYAPALSAAGIDLARLLIVRAETTEEILWATEQSLRSGNCAAVLSWTASAPVAALRRLQLAASEGGTFGVIFRPIDVLDNPSPAAVRMLLRQTPAGLDIDVLKARGGRPGKVQLSLGAALTREAAGRIRDGV
ncbi:MAG: translesion DNA synthesis-associated protein ImuA [Gammaproteobacteria bacterium]|nr:translesion DNA synthesis-associated protein ImuA [Gammaproteobacteria bacterium]